MPHPTATWVDTHCHLDAPEFDVDRLQVRQAARAAGVGHCVLVAVERSHWQAVRDLAHATGDSYALGIHPLYTPQAQEGDIDALRSLLTQWRDDPQLVAVGEIGLDFFVPTLKTEAARARQQWFYTQQVALAQALQLRPCGWPFWRCSAVRYSHCGGMSGASVSSTRLSSGKRCAKSRNFSARS